MLYFSLFVYFNHLFFKICSWVFCYFCNLSSWKALFQLETSSFCASSSAGLLLLSPFTLFEIHTLQPHYFSKTHTIFLLVIFDFWVLCFFSFPLYILYKNALFWVFIYSDSFRLLFFGCGNIYFWWNSVSFPSKSKSMNARVRGSIQTVKALNHDKVNFICFFFFFFLFFPLPFSSGMSYSFQL